MSDLVLHIGTHKTGTTTIQDTLFHNRALLRARGVVYPRIGEVAPHHNLVTRWIDLPPQFRARKSALENWTSLARGWAGGDETVLLSSEEFSRLMPTAVDFRELRGLVEGFGRRRVAMMFRNQLGFIQSVYVQVAKSQAFVDFDYFVSQCVRSKFATGLALDYNLLVDHVLAGFSRDELVLFSYEASVAAEGGLVGAFCRRLALPVAAGELVPLPAGDSNVSPTPLALWLANRAAAPGRASRALVALAEELLVAAVGPGTRTTLYTRAQVGRIRRTFQTANRRLQARARASQPDFAMAPLRLHPDTLHRDDLDTEALVAALRRAAAEGKPFPPLPAPRWPVTTIMTTTALDAAPEAAAPAPAPSPAPAPAPALAAPPVQGAASFEGFRTRPAPIAVAAERMVVAWSPKSACSHVALWTFLHEGLADEAAAYHEWPHEYRMRVYYRTPRFRRFAHAVSDAGGRGYTLLKVTRDPAKRLVSMFRHACRFDFMAPLLRQKLGLDLVRDGLSLRDFAAALDGLPLTAPTGVDPHLCAQYHPVWDWGWDRVITLNIDQTGLDAGLNAVEAEFGMAPTDFGAHPAFAALHQTHYAQPARLELAGPIEDHRFAFGRQRRFPSRQLLASPLVGELVRKAYAVDLGRTDLADSDGVLFRAAPEPVA